MKLGLDNRVALVMGASRGIGRAIAAALAREGAKVAIASRSPEKLEEAATEIGSGVTPFAADAADLDRLEDLPSEVKGKLATERLADASGSLDGAEEAAKTEVPAARLGQPEEYGDLVAFLCSERAAYITGTVIPIDGGLLRSAF
jgi:NAD(P)-dependent dehydrogenase (short-subunit alcohol dehydrogenase family)